MPPPRIATSKSATAISTKCRRRHCNASGTGVRDGRLPRMPRLRRRPVLFAAAVGALLPVAAVEVAGAAGRVFQRPYESDFALYYGVSTIGLQSGFSRIYEEALRVHVWAELA